MQQIEWTDLVQKKNALEKMKLAVARWGVLAQPELIYYPDANGNHGERCRIDVVAGELRLNISREEAEAAIATGKLTHQRTKRTGAEVWVLR